MQRLLHIPASPPRAGSRTRAVATRFIEQYSRSHPGLAVEELDIWSADLPPFDEAMIAAKFAVLRGTTASEQQRALWERAVRFSAAFNAADIYVFGVPMWNFGIPYRLKHYIDIVTLPGQNWRWSAAEGYVPLLAGKKAIVVYSSAGDYPVHQASERDHQKPQMREWLAFLGIHDVREVGVAPTLAAPDKVAAAVQDAMAQADDMAAAMSE